jgi:hypothetical protein
MQTLKAETIQLLASCYNITELEKIPEPREKEKWKNDNKFGFFRGVIEHGFVDAQITELHRLLKEGQLQTQDHFSKATEENTFMDKLYSYYIFPFKQHYGPSGSCNSVGSSSGNSTLLCSPSSLRKASTQSKTLTHYSLQKALEKRDKGCLFCWDW